VTRRPYAREVPEESPAERPGETFDAVAEAYDRVRPGYPDELIDTAFAVGGLVTGARVLEVGCGTGKLTEALVERGLRIDAIDPGPNMIAVARRRTGGSKAVEFHLGRFEDVHLPRGAFAGVFSATAFHWVDPTVGWTKVAHVLRPGGTLALLMHIGYRREETAAEVEALRVVLQKHLGDQEMWRPLRDLPALEAGVAERSGDVSAVWTWLGHHDLESPDAAALFDDVRWATVPLSHAETADQLCDFLETTSSFQRLEPRPREALQHDIRDLIERLGGAIRFSDLAVLVTARRSDTPAVSA
jgi:SAM-dependent methyltransferase